MQQTEKAVPNAQAQGSAPQGTPAAPAAPQKKKPPVAVIAILGVGLLVGAVFGGKWWLHRMAYVSTDDAQVAGNLITVSSRVNGHIQHLYVDEGQQVKKGQILADLDQADFKVQLAQAKAALDSASTQIQASQTGVSFQRSQTDAQIAQARSNLSSARANLQTALANAEKAHSDLGKYQRLYQEGGVSTQALETAQTSAKSADGSVDSARGQVAAAEQSVALAGTGNQAVEIKRSGVLSAQAQLEQAKAAVDAAQLNMSHTVITAPQNGIIARRMTNAGEQISTGQGVFSLAETDDVWVLAYIEETSIRRVHEGADVDVEIDAFPGRTFHGKVSFVDAVTGAQFSLLPQDNASGNYTKVVQRLPVKVLVDDPNHELKPGMSAVIDIDARSH